MKKAGLFLIGLFLIISACQLARADLTQFLRIHNPLKSVDIFNCTDVTVGSGLTVTDNGSGYGTITTDGSVVINNPMTTLGDTLYEDANPAPARLAGNTTTTQKFLSQTGTGTISAAPSWQPISFQGTLSYYFTNVASDVSTYLKQTTAPQVAKVTLNTAGVNTTRVLQNFITEPGFPGVTFIPKGQYTFHIHCDSTNPASGAIYAEIWEADSVGADIGKIGTTENTDTLRGLNTTETEYELIFTNPNVYTLSTANSRIVCRVWFRRDASTHSVDLYVGGLADSHLSLPSNTVDATNFVPYTGATSDVNLGTHVETAANYISNVTTGTQPYAATSTTVNTNLNADLLDGNHATDLMPPGGIIAWPLYTAPSGYLWCDGSAVSRSTYANLFSAIAPSKGAFTVNIQAGAVISLTGHGMMVNDAFYVTTDGALPTGLSANTIYYVRAASYGANSFTFSTSRGGGAVTTSGNQSGNHTLYYCPYGLGNGSTTFNVPNYKGKSLFGFVASADTNFGYNGQTGGATTHTHTVTTTLAGGAAVGTYNASYSSSSNSATTSNNNTFSVPFTTANYIIKT